MKRILALMLSVILAVSLCACVSKTGNEDVKSESETQSNVSENKESEKKNEDTKDFESWKEFLGEYEAWVDEYVAVLKKFKENPTDAAVIAEQKNKLSELTGWTDRTGKIQKELENASPKVLEEYKREVERIITKIAEAAK